MKKIFSVVFVFLFVLTASDAFAKKIHFPDNGWHKGPYLTANGGMMQVTNDQHSVTDQKFNGTFVPSFGLTFGWDIADWIGPMLQMNYATTKVDVGRPTAFNKTINGIDYNFPAGTFPSEQGREHAIDVGIYAKATLPYFTRASWQPNMIKFIPYAKLGGVANAVYVNAPTNANKAGAVGGGIGFGAGVEFFIWKGLFFAIDATEVVIFQKGFNKTIDATPAGGALTPTDFQVTPGGTAMQFNLQGLLGWHF